MPLGEEPRRPAAGSTPDAGAVGSVPAVAVRSPAWSRCARASARRRRRLGLLADRGRRRRRCGSPSARGRVWVDERRRRHPDRGSTPKRASGRRAAAARHRGLRRRRRRRLGLGLEPARPATVLRVDPQRRRDRQDPQVGGSPGAIVFGGGRVWVADEDGAGVSAIDAAGDGSSGAASSRTRRRCASRSAPAASGSAAPRPARCAASTSAPLAAGAPILAGRGPAGVTVGGGLVWVANSRSDTVTRVDPSTHSILARPDRGRRPARRHRRRHQRRLGRQRRRRHGHPDRPRKRRVGRATRSSVGPEPGAVAVGEKPSG